MPLSQYLSISRASNSIHTTCVSNSTQRLSYNYYNISQLEVAWSLRVRFVRFSARRRRPPFLLRRLEFGSEFNPRSVSTIQEGLNEEIKQGQLTRPASNP